jgi:hypothetical protein
MKGHANVAGLDQLSADAGVSRGSTSTSWDPHEVWLTRVKQPRERAAGQVTPNADSQALSLSD